MTEKMFFQYDLQAPFFYFSFPKMIFSVFLKKDQKMAHTAQAQESQNYITLVEFAERAGLNLSSIPTLNRSRVLKAPNGDLPPVDLEEMKSSIARTTHDRYDVLALAVKVDSKKVLHAGTTYGVLMILFRDPLDKYTKPKFPDSVFTLSTESSEINRVVSMNHNYSPEHSGKWIDVCPNCFLINNWWRIEELIKIVNRKSEHVILL